MFGGTVGFNMQTGAFVFGVEGDVDGNWMKSSNSTGVCAFGCGIQTSWFATARARVGYAFDRALFYVTAGGAFGDVQISANGLSRTESRPRWSLGPSLGYFLLRPLSSKAPA